MIGARNIGGALGALFNMDVGFFYKVQNFPDRIVIFRIRKIFHRILTFFSCFSRFSAFSANAYIFGVVHVLQIYRDLPI